MNAKDFETVLNDISSDINEVFTLITQKCKELENDLLELKNQREQSLKEAFEKGYEEGCLKGYNDHVKLTNTLYK